MRHYVITVRSSGQRMGTYAGETPREAHEAMWRDAGYASLADGARAVGQSVEQVEADTQIEAAPIAHDYETGAALAGAVDEELAAASRATAVGAVSAYLADGVWRECPDGREQYLASRGHDVRVVYVAD